jgi:hypothetical protein
MPAAINIRGQALLWYDLNVITEITMRYTVTRKNVSNDPKVLATKINIEQYMIVRKNPFIP